MDASTLSLLMKDGEARVPVHAKPRDKRDKESAILGVREGALEVAIAAPPVDGAANAELIATLARALAVPEASVRLVRGEGGRNKVVGIAGLDEAEVRARLAAI